MCRTFAAEIADAVHVFRKTLIDNGLREVRERYSWDVVMPHYRRLLRI
jgi:hypothetical protein